MPIVEDFKTFLGKQEVTKQGGNFSPLLYSSSLYFLSGKFYNKYYSSSFGLFVAYTNESEGESFFSMDKYKECTIETYTKTNIDIAELENYRDFLSLSQDVYKAYDKNNNSRIYNRELENLSKNLLNWNELFSLMLVSTIFVEALDEDFIETKLLEIQSELNIQEFIVSSQKLTFESFEAKMLQSILNFKENKCSLENVQWIFCDYFTVPETSEILEKIEEKFKSIDVKKHLAQINTNISKNTIEIEDYKKGLNQSELKLFNFVQKSMEIRDVRKSYLLKILTLEVNFARAVLSKLNIDLELVPYCHIGDFANGTYLVKDYSKILLKRKAGVLVCVDPNSCSRFEYDDLENKLIELNKILIQNQNISEVYGKTASKGKVFGKIKIVLSQKDFTKFEENDILVTSMTRPEFLPLMRKAKAIITDEGGITCHAAIVSRELGIPCIIGTKIATKVLKNGDFVEVDADSGVVRVLH